MCTVVLVLMFAVPCAIKPSGVFLDSKLLLGFVFSLLVFRWQETYEDGSSYEGQLADGRQGPKSGIDLACFRKRVPQGLFSSKSIRSSSFLFLYTVELSKTGLSLERGRSQ